MHKIRIIVVIHLTTHCDHVSSVLSDGFTEWLKKLHGCLDAKFKDNFKPAREPLDRQTVREVRAGFFNFNST